VGATATHSGRTASNAVSTSSGGVRLINSHQSSGGSAPNRSAITGAPYHDISRFHTCFARLLVAIKRLRQFGEPGFPWLLGAVRAAGPEIGLCPAPVSPRRIPGVLPRLRATCRSPVVHELRERPLGGQFLSLCHESAFVGKLKVVRDTLRRFTLGGL